VFVRGRLVYLTSIIPNSANAVSKTVVVDAATNKLVAIFDNDRDPQAEAKTQRYIETGEVPEDAAAPGAGDDSATTPPPASPGGTGTTTTPAPGSRGVGPRLDDVIRRQRELLREVQRLRETLREQERKGP